MYFAIIVDKKIEINYKNIDIYRVFYQTIALFENNFIN